MFSVTFLLSVAAFEVNFMDDVGQTLLNWASAFGTQEMVRRETFISRLNLRGDDAIFQLLDDSVKFG